MKRTTRTAVGGLMVAAALVLAGCSDGGTSSTSGPAEGGDLVIARPADAVSMNNTTTFDNPSIYTFQQIMEPLFTVSDDGQTLKPWLASDYTVSDDKLSYTIKLRSGVKFSDGTPLTADDVKFSIDADTATAETGWGYINAAIDSVSVIDEETVDIKLKYAWAPMIADLSLFSNAIVPANYGGKTAEEFYEAPVGTGPFKWGEWKKGQSLKLVKNDNYWQEGKPSLDSVTWSVVPDANTRKLQLEGGQVDVIEAPDWSSFSSLGNSGEVLAQTFPSTQIDYLAFNQERAPFDDIHIRRAIAYSVDREALVKAVLFGNGTPANSLLSPGTPFYNEDEAGPTYDPAKAKAELAQSSKPDGFSTTLLIRSGDANQASVAQILQSELAKLGITVEIKQLDPTANKQARLASDFDMTLSAWTMDIPDPDQWTSFAVDPEGGSRSAFTAYNNPAVVDLNRRAQLEVDSNKRQELYNELQKLTGEDAFLAYTYYSPYAYGLSDKVEGFKVTPLGNYHLEDITKSK